MFRKAMTGLAFAAALSTGFATSASALDPRDVPELRRLASQMENDAEDVLDALRDQPRWIPGQGDRRVGRDLRRFIDATQDFGDEIAVSHSRRSMVDDSLSRMNDRASRVRSVLNNNGWRSFTAREWERIERRLSRINQLYWRGSRGGGRDIDRAYRLFRNITR